MSQGHELWVVFKQLIAVVAVVFIFRCPKYLNSKHLQGMIWVNMLKSSHQAVRITHVARHHHVRCW